MSEEELKNKVLEIICNMYKAVYVGYLKIVKVGDVYRMYLGVPTETMPTNFDLQCNSDEEFLNFIEEEFKRRNYLRRVTYNVIRTNDPRQES